MAVDLSEPTRVLQTPTRGEAGTVRCLVIVISSTADHNPPVIFTTAGVSQSPEGRPRHGSAMSDALEGVSRVVCTAGKAGPGSCGPSLESSCAACSTESDVESPAVPEAPSSP